MISLQRGSITVRIFVGVLALILGMGAAIYLLADRDMVRLVDDRYRQVYGDRLRSIVGLLERLEERLDATGNREAYGEQFRELALRDLRAMEAGTTSLVKPVVYGPNGAVLFRLQGGEAVAPDRAPEGLLDLPSGVRREIATPAWWGVYQRFPAWGWTVGYVVPVPDKYAEVTAFRKGFALVLLLVMAVASLLALALVASIVRPITRLTRAAAAMAKGDLNQPITDGHSDEVGVLAAAFMRLQAAVRERIEELAAKNDALVREVEERKRAEGALQQALLDLERHNEELKVLDRIKDGLIRDVTHELKTPVAKFRMQAELLRDFLSARGLAQEAEGMLEVVDQSVARQEGVIRNILNLARLEGGGSRYRRSRIELAGFVGGIIEDFASLSARAGLEVKAALEPVTVGGDAEILRHAVANLLDNAIKFRRREGGAWMRIRTGMRRGKAELIVEDNGVGMTADELDHACDRFFQGSASTEGSGVGLAIVRRIVLDHGGSISMTSEGPGKGTTVTVTLPLAGS